MKKILAIDIGYGSVKVIYGYSDNTIKNQFKFTNGRCQVFFLQGKAVCIGKNEKLSNSCA